MYACTCINGQLTGPAHMSVWAHHYTNIMWPQLAQWSCLSSIVFFCLEMAHTNLPTLHHALTQPFLPAAASCPSAVYATSNRPRQYQMSTAKCPPLLVLVGDSMTRSPSCCSTTGYLGKQCLTLSGMIDGASVAPPPATRYLQRHNCSNRNTSAAPVAGQPSLTIAAGLPTPRAHPPHVHRFRVFTL